MPQANAAWSYNFTLTAQHMFSALPVSLLLYLGCVACHALSAFTTSYASGVSAHGIDFSPMVSTTATVATMHACIPS